MPKYEVKIQVNFEGVIEAADEQEAELMAHTAWGETFDSKLTYESIEDIEVIEMEDEDEESTDY